MQSHHSKRSSKVHVNVASKDLAAASSRTEEASRFLLQQRTKGMRYMFDTSNYAIAVATGNPEQPWVIHCGDQVLSLDDFVLITGDANKGLLYVANVIHAIDETGHACNVQLSDARVLLYMHFRNLIRQGRLSVKELIKAGILSLDFDLLFWGDGAPVAGG